MKHLENYLTNSVMLTYILGNKGRSSIADFAYGKLIAPDSHSRAAFSAFIGRWSFKFFCITVAL